MWKFVGGPVAGLAAGLTVVETALLTTAGMMTTVVILTYAGERVRKVFRKKNDDKKNKNKSIRMIKIWNKYGVPGISFLTPLILTPIGGTLILVAYKAPKKDIMLGMLVSALAWAFIQTFFFKFFYDEVSSWF
jgi:hypothetical protein